MSESSGNRIEEIDALRGFALFGILLVNVFVFHAPIKYYGEFYGAFEGVQAMAVNGVVNFAGGKFLFIFAFLFGYGIVLQQNSRPNSFNIYFVKRMAVLLLIGIVHIALFWFGDILASYALLGFLVIPLLRLSKPTILVLAIFFILFRPLYYFGVVLFDWPSVQMGELVSLEEFVSVFQEGSYFEIFKLRMREFGAFIPENLVWYISKTFGLFLVGIYAARINLFTQMKLNSIKFTQLTLLFILVSVLWNYFKLDVFGLFDLQAQPIWRPILISINVFFETTLGMGYILGFSLVFQNSQLLTNILAKTGRLALTNYLFQSLICVIVFYGFGFGQYAKWEPTDLVLFSAALFG
ncbi:MAG: DUF418 domain-containing protein, partial [Salibacteraceae bacterium]